MRTINPEFSFVITGDPSSNDHGRCAEAVEPYPCRMFWLLLALTLFFLFYQIGAAGLFEPDEGRNAEKARQIFLLNDWVTPHENFLPVLDKPMFFYWLVALSYKMFGMNEGAARLPSALAALGCFALVFRWVRKRWGTWEALWSGLILISCVEFFVLSRLVNLEMTLAVCITLALYAFHEASHAATTTRRNFHCVVLYGALGAGTLLKGLIALVLPGLIIFFYLCWTNQWAILRRIHPVAGTLLYIAIAAPWYLMADARNTGFLQYYVWNEHFGRYGTPDFGRSHSWHFFLPVLFVGFLPWSTLLPLVIKRHCQRRTEDKTIFIALWVVVPLIFFSFSQSKLPHYILAVFPALAIVTGTTLADLLRDGRTGIQRPLALLWCFQGLSVLYLLAGWMWPVILPAQIRQPVNQVGWLLVAYGSFCAVISILLLGIKVKTFWNNQPKVYLAQALGMIFFLGFVTQMKVAVARERSAGGLSEMVAGQLGAATQLVFYDTYISGMPLYLKLDRPVWVVTHARKRKTVLGNFYAATARPWPDTRWGRRCSISTSSGRSGTRMSNRC